MSDPSRSRGLAVLVVDDHRFSREYTAAALREMAGSVKQAESAVEALEAALHDLPDLIITDVDLAGDSGLDLIRHIRERWPAGRPLPRVVVLTAERPRPDQQFAVGSGVETFLVKPAEPEQLRHLLAPESLPAVASSAPTNEDPELHRLFRRELLSRLDDLDDCISRRDLAAAGAILHQLIASSRLRGERGLASKMRALLAACRHHGAAAGIAGSYYSMWVGARYYLDSVEPGTPA
jgi:CheY-like chemotaxis protein